MMDIIIRESFSHQHKGDFLYMSEIHQPDEGTKEALPSPDAPSKENVSVDHILSHLFQKSDLLYKFVMIYKDYIFQPRDYGTGELVTSMEAHVTSYIDEHPGAAPSELAAYWSRTNGFISQILKKLEEKGFIIRTRSPQNAKRVLLYTTEKGKAFSYAHKRFDALNVSISMQRLLQSCSMEEVDAFYKVMDAYCDLFLKYGVEGIIPEDSGESSFPFFAESIAIILYPRFCPGIFLPQKAEERAVWLAPLLSSCTL